MDDPKKYYTDLKRYNVLSSFNIDNNELANGECSDLSAFNSKSLGGVIRNNDDSGTVFPLSCQDVYCDKTITITGYASISTLHIKSDLSSASGTNNRLVEMDNGYNGKVSASKSIISEAVSTPSMTIKNWPTMKTTSDSETDLFPYASREFTHTASDGTVVTDSYRLTYSESKNFLTDDISSGTDVYSFTVSGTYNNAHKLSEIPNGSYGYTGTRESIFGFDLPTDNVEIREFDPATNTPYSGPFKYEKSADGNTWIMWIPRINEY